MSCIQSRETTIEFTPRPRRVTARAGGAGAATSYGYDAAGRLGTLTQSLTGGAAVTYTLGYDPANGLISRQVSNGTYNFHAAASSTSYASNGLNQFTTITPGGTSTYDPKGPMTYDASTGVNFTYDPDSRLFSASGPTAVTLRYDPLGRLWTKIANGVTTTFLQAGEMIVGEYAGTGAIQSRYVPGPAADEAALWYSGAGTATPQWLHADPQGSTIAWSNAAGASACCRFRGHGDNV